MIRAQVLAWYADHPGAAEGECAAGIGSTTATVRRILEAEQRAGRAASTRTPAPTPNGRGYIRRWMLTERTDKRRARTLEVLIDTTSSSVEHEGFRLIMVTFRWSSDDRSMAARSVFIPQEMLAALETDDADIEIAVVRAR